jgi:hypothetical protein
MGDLSAHDVESVLPTLKELRAEGSMDSSWEDFHARLLAKFGVQQDSDSAVIEKLTEEITRQSTGDPLTTVKTLTAAWEQEEKTAAPAMELPGESEVVEAIVNEVEAVIQAAMNAAEDLASFPELAEWIKEAVEAELTRLANLDI